MPEVPTKFGPDRTTFGVDVITYFRILALKYGFSVITAKRFEIRKKVITSTPHKVG